MLQLVQDGIRKTMKGLKTDETLHKVLLFTNKGEVELPSLRDAKHTVLTTESQLLRALPLKEQWLDGKDDCSASCCAPRREPTAPVLTPPKPPTTDKSNAKKGLDRTRSLRLSSEQKKSASAPATQTTATPSTAGAPEQHVRHKLKR